MHARSRVADLRTRHDRGTVDEATRAHGSAHRLGNVLVGFERGVWALGAETLDGSHDNARVDLVDLLPAKAKAIEHTRPEILHHDVAGFDEVCEYLFALVVLEVDGDRALVAVQHREIEAVCARNVDELLARRIAHGRLELDHVRAEKAHELTRRRSRLHMRHVEDSNSRKCLVRAHRE